jgi:hypothetical protein
MTETAKRPLMPEMYRPMTGEELLAMLIIAGHQGLDPLELASVERRMVPHPFNESFLLEARYIQYGKNPRTGRELRHTATITSEGLNAMSRTLEGTLASIEARKTTPDLAPKQIPVLHQLAETVKQRYAEWEQAQDRRPRQAAPQPTDDDGRPRRANRAREKAVAAAEAPTSEPQSAPTAPPGKPKRRGK